MNEKKDFFGIKKAGSSVKVEIFAGIATFLAMSYILTVNPNQMLRFNVNDPKWSSVFLATALGAIVGTLLMAFLAKMPYAQASGMGLNSMVGTIVGASVGISYSFGNAMLIILIDGILFLLVSIIPIGRDKKTKKLITLREKIFDGMPKTVRTAITVGIGLFICYIGFQNAHVINANQFTLTEFVNLASKDAWAPITYSEDGVLLTGTARFAIVALFGLFVIAVLDYFKVKGAVIIGILAGTVLAIPLGVADVNTLLGKTDGVTWKFWENFANFFSFDSSKGGVFFAAFTEGFDMPKGSFMNTVMLIITFAMIDMFDTMGTVVGCATNAGLVDEDGKPLAYDKIMYADSIATCTGALLGTSTVTTFVESGAGVAAGGKTGLTALVVAILFFLSIFLLPVFAFIPSAAAASALIYVGVLMMSNVKNIDFSSVKNSVPAFLTIVVMLLGYSITKGIGVGLISYVIIATLIYVVEAIKYSASKKNNPEAVKPVWDVSVVAIVVTCLFLFYFLMPTVIK